MYLHVSVKSLRNLINLYYSVVNFLTSNYKVTKFLRRVWLRYSMQLRILSILLVNN